MKARIVKDGNSITLLTVNRMDENVSDDKVKEFIFNYNNPEYYKTKPIDTFFAESLPQYVGEDLFVVNDDMELVVKDIDFFKTLLQYDADKFLTAREYAEKYNKKPGIIKRFCREGRLQGATQKGNSWLIPEDAPYPEDTRFKRV